VRELGLTEIGNSEVFFLDVIGDAEDGDDGREGRGQLFAVVDGVVLVLQVHTARRQSRHPPRQTSWRPAGAAGARHRKKLSQSWAMNSESFAV
jgi:hypothetical protein